MANFWDISETVSLMSTRFFKNRVVSYIVLLENSSNRQFENSGASHIPFYWKTHPDLIQMDELSSKTAIVTPPNWNFEKMDDVSSNTACVTT